MRLLTELEAITACKTGLPSNTPWEDICKAQRNLTHKETLKAVGEAINDYAHNKISFERLAELLEVNFYELDIAFCKRGEMPTT